MRDALGRSQVLAGTYVPVDVRSLVSGGLSAEVGTELVQGTERLSALLGTRVDPRTEIARPANDASLTRLRDAGVDRVDRRRRRPHATGRAVHARPAVRRCVVNRARPPPSGPTPDCSGSSRATIRPHCAPNASSPDSSAVALEQPNTRRGVVVLEPDDWNGSGDAARVRLGRVDLRPSPAGADDRRSSCIEHVPPATSGSSSVLERELTPSPVPPPPVTAARVPRRRDRARRLQRARPTAEPAWPSAANRSLLVSLSSAWSGPGGRARARAELAKIDTAVSQFVSRLRVPRRQQHDHVDRREGPDPRDVPERDRPGAARPRAPRQRQARVPGRRPADAGSSPPQHDRAVHRRDPQLGDLPAHAHGDVARRRLAHPADGGAGAVARFREQRRACS